MVGDRRVSDFYVEDYKCGEGATCVVQKCRNKLTGAVGRSTVSLSPTHPCAGAPCAIKSRIDPYDEIGRHGMYNELRILQILSKDPHPSIPALEDCFFDKSGDIRIAMEYMNRGELSEMIQQRRGLAEDNARDLFFQVADGVRHLHQNCIAHRDIKPSNIMLAQCPDGKYGHRLHPGKTVVRVWAPCPGCSARSSITTWREQATPSNGLPAIPVERPNSWRRRFWRTDSTPW